MDRQMDCSLLHLEYGKWIYVQTSLHFLRSSTQTPPLSAVSFPIECLTNGNRLLIECQTETQLSVAPKCQSNVYGIPIAV